MAPEKNVRTRARTNEPITVIKVGGYIDFTTSDELDRVLQEQIKQRNYRIILDLAEVDYISSRGWSIFLSRIKEIRDNNGDLKLARMKADVFEVFELLEFFWFIRSYQTIEEAVKDFDKDVPPMPQ